ncbi:MAG TPA: hypothetical protein VG937_09375 [Polyangiaceae bacterium]|nr:hypothetical protein [Polyangiaceae bacterium]
MSTARSIPKLRALVVTAGLLVAASVAAQKNEGQETLVRRYPFDPACAWGRIANGKGMIVRCMSEEEANLVLKRAPAAAAPRPPEPAPGSSSVGGSSSTAAPSPEGSDTEPSEAPSTGDNRMEVTVGPVTADQGELSVGKLAQPKSRYLKCVADHGGLKDKSGEVHVRFLVRSKGIAEGVSVQKRVNVSAEAARCVAEVVDRRRVGIPDAPLVGATVVVKFDKTAK